MDPVDRLHSLPVLRANVGGAGVTTAHTNPWSHALAILLALAIAPFLGCSGRGKPAVAPEPQKLGSGTLRPEPVTISTFGLLPVGDVRIATEAVEETFGFSAARTDSGDVPGQCSTSDGRTDALALLDHLVDTMPLDAVRVLGLTETDLFHPDAEECMGLGQIEGKSAVVSLRIPGLALEKDLAAGRQVDASRELYRSRLRKLVRHELAHTFMPRGFTHCGESSCLMSAVERGVGDLDLVGERFCVECARDLSEAVRGPVNTPVTFYNLGLYFEERGLSDRAVMAYERALLGDPRMAPALNNLGVVSLKAGRLNSAADYLRKAVGADPAYALAMLNLGRALAASGDSPGALSQFESCIAADPKMTAALKEGGLLLRDALGDQDRAGEWLWRWVRAGGRDDAIERWLASRSGGGR